MLENLSMMFSIVLQPDLMLLTFIGVTIGIIIGVLPGLNASMGLAVLLPLTYALQPLSAMMLFFGIYAGSNYGGSVTAILINTPGTAQAAATSLDGYPMTQQGEAGRALGMAAIASGIGGIFSTLVLIIFAPPVATAALAFGPAEFAALCLFGLSLITVISTGSTSKSLISTIFGILLGVVGMDKVSGVSRFNFGSVYLMGGFDFLVVLIGMFAMSEVFLNMELLNKGVQQFSKKISAKITSLEDLKKSRFALISGCLTGTFIGALPGAGATVASFINYGITQRFSKNKDKFGKGAIEGIAASECANNAAAGGAMIPLLTLGIPGSGSTAVMLGALSILGIRPGPFLFIEQPELVWGWFGGFLISNVMFVILALVAVRLFTTVLYVPTKILYPIIGILCLVGAYAFHNRIGDMVAVVIFGLVGYLFKKVGIPVPPMILALILMPIIEENLRLGLMITGGQWMPILTKPIVVVCLVITGLVVIAPPIIDVIKKRKKESTTS